MVGAVGLSEDSHCGRIRLERISDRSSRARHGFVRRRAEPSTHVITDGLIRCGNMPDNTREPKVVSGQKAHGILHRVHRVFSNRKRWATDVVGQIRPLDGFVPPPTPRLSPAAHPTPPRRGRLPREPPAPSAHGLRPTPRDRCRSRAGPCAIVEHRARSGRPRPGGTSAIPNQATCPLHPSSGRLSSPTKHQDAVETGAKGTSL